MNQIQTQELLIKIMNYNITVQLLFSYGRGWKLTPSIKRCKGYKLEIGGQEYA